MRHSNYRALLWLGIPIVIGQIGVIILGFADTLMIGHHSTHELAAASFVNNMFNLAIIFSTGFSYGLTPIVGSLFGQNRCEEVGRTLKNSLAANTLLAAIVCLVMAVLYWNIDKLGQPEELLPTMRPYYLVLLASLPFVLWFNGFKQFTDGITDTRISMWILLGGNVLNIIGNYLLIYGKAGFPELGLLGAGIATLTSRILMVITYLILFFGTSRYATFRKGFAQGSLNKSDFGLLNKLGWPIAGQMGMETASFSLSAIMVGWLGSTALASYQIMMAVSQVCFMMYYGMGSAVSVRISYFFGQNDLENVRHTAKKRIPHHSGHDCHHRYTYLPAPPLHRRLVYQRRSCQSDGSTTDYPLPAVSVWRRIANQFCQCAARYCRRTPYDVVLVHRLFPDFLTCRLSLRICLWLGSHRYLGSFSFRTYQCRNHVLPAIQI